MGMGIYIYGIHAMVGGTENRGGLLAGRPIVQIELARQPVMACFYVSGQGLRSSGLSDGLLL